MLVLRYNGNQCIKIRLRMVYKQPEIKYQNYAYCIELKYVVWQLTT